MRSFKDELKLVSTYFFYEKLQPNKVNLENFTSRLIILSWTYFYS